MTFCQLAEQDPEELFESLNGKFPALRIDKNRWVEQARELCKTSSEPRVSDLNKTRSDGPLE
jgi:hypothetical protein